MPTLGEYLNEGPIGPTQIHDALVVGLDVLSGEQTVEFVPYIRTVLPVDGFVFWIRASLLSPDRLAAAGLPSADPIVVPGSLHYASLGTQVEDENIAIQRVDFAAQKEISDFAQIAPNILYVADWITPLGAFQFTFSSRSTYYVQANISHYVGDAVYPVFRSMLIENLGQLDQRQVVSNSMPLWLALQGGIPFVSLITSNVPLYPAYLVPNNLPAPYGTIDIPPNTTRALQAQAYRDRNSSRWQLAAETARIVFYGLRNDEVVDFIDYVNDWSLNTGDFGIMNMPVPLDERRPQVELSVLAMKKTVVFEVSYQQSRMRDIARRLIDVALIGHVYPADQPLIQPPDRIIEPFMAPDDPLIPWGVPPGAI